MALVRAKFISEGISEGLELVPLTDCARWLLGPCDSIEHRTQQKDVSGLRQQVGLRPVDRETWVVLEAVVGVPVPLRPDLGVADERIENRPNPLRRGERRWLLLLLGPGMSPSMRCPPVFECHGALNEKLFAASSTAPPAIVNRCDGTWVISSECDPPADPRLPAQLLKRHQWELILAKPLDPRRRLIRHENRVPHERPLGESRHVDSSQPRTDEPFEDGAKQDLHALKQL